ncbi:MAG: hypothetical protein ACE15F_21785 [bacterium]
MIYMELNLLFLVKRRKIMRGFYLSFLSLGWLVIAMAPPAAERNIVNREQGYLPGLMIYVNIKTPNPSGNDTIVEIPPAGWKISHVDPTKGAIVEEDKITWDTKETSNYIIYSYAVNPPETAAGNALFTGTINGLAMGGDTAIAPHVKDPIGIFEDHVSFGGVPLGDASYDSQKDEYTVIGSGRAPDPSAHCAYRKISGPVSISAEVTDEISSSSSWLGAGLCFYDELADDSFFYAFLIGTGNAAYLAHGTVTSWQGIFPANDGTSDNEIKIARDGDRITAYYFRNSSQEWILLENIRLRPGVITDPIYVTLSSWTPEIQSYSTGFFTNVVLTLPSAVENWNLY